MASRGGGGGRGGAAKRGRGGRNPGKQQRSAWSNSNKQAPGADREITCKDCSASFTFTARAQALHHEQGYGDPVRCQPCRKSKRERNESDAAAQASGQPRAGLTYEEKRVLGKNRKERRAEAAEAGDLLRGENAKPAAEPAAGQPAAGQTFSKGMDPQEAMDAPRSFALKGELQVESTLAKETYAALEARGHVLKHMDKPIGGSQAVMIDPKTGVLTGASDPRKDGCALGY